jgi:choline dehydrogenase
VILDHGRVTGVSVLLDGVRHEVSADEVVLSAGAIHSPAVLLRSGIGPAAELAELSIPVQADLAVGRGFQEHPHVYFGFPVADDLPMPCNGRHTNACIRWSSGLDGIDNDLMGMVIGPAPASPGYAGLGLFANRPFARGRVSLVSTDPTTDPRVQMSLADDQRDLARLRECVSASRELLAAPELAGLMLGKPAGIDGTALEELRDKADVDEFIRRTVDGSAHASCTCPIGAVEDAGVVDELGRVHGISGLRVLDMSISPSVPRANTNLTAIMIGELICAVS